MSLVECKTAADVIENAKVRERWRRSLYASKPVPERARTPDEITELVEIVSRAPLHRPGWNPMRAIQKVVAEFYGLTLAELLARRRNKPLVTCRHVAMYLCKKNTSASLPEIGRRFGGMDHTSVIHAIRRIERLMDTDPALRAEIDAIRARIEG